MKYIAIVRVEVYTEGIEHTEEERRLAFDMIKEGIHLPNATVESVQTKDEIIEEVHNEDRG